MERIESGREFRRWITNARTAGGPLYARALSLLQALRELPAEPTEDSATFKRVRQAKRYQLWRIAHPFHSDVAVRILCWFPQPDQVVVALVGGDKKSIGDVWYTSAVVRAEAAVDQWKRENPGRSA